MFKALVQIALFLLTPYMTEQEKVVASFVKGTYICIQFFVICLVYDSLVISGV